MPTPDTRKPSRSRRTGRSISRAGSPSGSALSGDPRAPLIHGPHAPERPRVGERIAVDEHEVRGHTLLDATGVLVPEQRAAVVRRRGERLVRLEARVDEELDLPGEVPGADRAAAEIGARRDADARLARERDRRVSPLLALRDALLPLRTAEPLDRR